MNEYAVAKNIVESCPAPWPNLDQYYSVEIQINEIGVVYQFKVWRIESTSIYILIKEDSALLPWLKVGDSRIMKYYSNDLTNPYQNLETEILDIIRQEYGRLRGHYLVGLEIKGSNNQDNARWPYRSNEALISPLNASLSSIYRD
ncbi:hypothetical protein ACFL7M_08100 [Thermodesulfobacteriota bacterium]